MVQVECLPIEIWLEIFSYLHPNHNIKAFSNLNQFFDRFATTKYFLIDRYLTKDECRSNPSKTFTQSLRLETFRSLTVGRRQRNRLIQFLRWHSDGLINLQKLSIYFQNDTVTDSMDIIINALKQLPSLKSLQVQSRGEGPTHWGCFAYSKIGHFLMAVFNELSALTHCQLLFSFENFHVRLCRWSGTSSIRCLALGKISWSNLLVILSQTDNLSVLKATIIDYQSKSSKLSLPTLRKVILTINRTPFVLLEEILRLAPRLASFTLEGLLSLDDENYFREDSWKKLLDQIPTYCISISKYAWKKNEIEQLRRISDSLDGKQWFKSTVDKSCLHGEISFKHSAW